MYTFYERIYLQSFVNSLKRINRYEMENQLYHPFLEKISEDNSDEESLLTNSFSQILSLTRRNVEDYFYIFIRLI